MARKSSEKKAQPEHSFLAIQVDDYDVQISVAINYKVENPKYAFADLRADEPVYKHITYLKIHGRATYPENRAGERFEFTVHGDDSPSKDLKATLKDVQVRDEFNSAEYRAYRGRQIPVVHPIPSLAFIDKNRAEQKRTVWLNVEPRLVSDMLTLLGSTRQIYVSLHEIKEGRTRWVRQFELQTTDPAEE
jgi:hypothetical protein